MRIRIGAATPLARIIRERPLAVATLEQWGRHRLWERPDAPLREFCQAVDAQEQDVIASLKRLGPPPEDAEWRSLPAYHLIDRLTLDHRRFRETDLPRLASLLDPEKAGVFPEAPTLVPLERAFVAFELAFRKHMDEEEVFLFPKIMRNEACYRFRELSPEVYKGSVNLYLATQTHMAEEEFKRAFADIREMARDLPAGHGFRSHVSEVLAELDGFDHRLEAHADLEMKELFPRAGRLEQELYETTAPGVSIYPDRA